MAASIGFVVIAVAMVLLYFGLRSAPYNSAHSPQEPASETAASAAAKTEQSSGSASAQASGYAAEAEDFGVVPVVSLRASELHAPTPLSVPGARTITTTDLANRLLARESLVLLYVGDEIEGGGIGMAGARWLKGAGFGTSFDDDIGKRLRRKLNTLSGNNYSAQIVVFCIDPHCWLSYNVVLRLVRIGYRNVSWYRGGITAWHEAQLPLTKLPEESW